VFTSLQGSDAVIRYAPATFTSMLPAPTSSMRRMAPDTGRYDDMADRSARFKCSSTQDRGTDPSI